MDRIERENIAVLKRLGKKLICGNTTVNFHKKAFIFNKACGSKNVHKRHHNPQQISKFGQSAFYITCIFCVSTQLEADISGYLSVKY